LTCALDLLPILSDANLVTICYQFVYWL